MPDCKSCKENRQNVEPVPYIAHESAMARMERTVKRLIIALFVVIALWFSTIGIFVWYLNQYDFESYEYTQDGQGLNIIGDRNGVDFHVAKGESSPQN
jgi:hypothetical protein